MSLLRYEDIASSRYGWKQARQTLLGPQSDRVLLTIDTVTSRLKRHFIGGQALSSQFIAVHLYKGIQDTMNFMLGARGFVVKTGFRARLSFTSC